MADETLITDTQDATQTADVHTTGAEKPVEAVSTAETQQTEGDKVDSEAAKPVGAPERYEFTAPEGRTFDAQVIEQFSDVAKELNLPQDAAQKVLDKMAPVLAARQSEAVSAVKAEWEASAKSDKEFGGDKLQENLGAAKRALDQYGTPELKALLNESGMGNHPEVIRAFYRIGKTLSEDKVVTGQTPSSKSAAQVLYDKSST